jgi:hypothetical protein
MIYDRATTMLVQYFHIGYIAIGEVELLILSLWCL